jgi:hypothetical protein
VSETRATLAPGTSLEVVVPGALLKIDVGDDGETTVLTFTGTGTEITGIAPSLRISPGADW